MQRIAISLTLAIAALACAGLASAELTQRGNLRLSFNGKLAPKELPRDAAAPVTMRLRGAIGTADGHRPPQVRKISIAVNRYGRVSTRGLPVCDRSEIEQTSSRAAMERCGPARVGKGHFRAVVELNGTDKVLVDGNSLAFNSRVDGRPTVLLHIYGDSPVQVAFVLSFKIVRVDEGEFGTVFVARIPKIASELGYVTNISLTFGRRYEVNGVERSFLSASCAAPAGFPGAIFNLARGSFTFSNGQRISSSLSRNCWVRQPGR
jgi:hypothetical protein